VKTLLPALRDLWNCFWIHYYNHPQ